MIRYTQNFLHDATLVEKLVNLADIQPGSTVLEIGPGKGIITRFLAEKVTISGNVIAVELDPDLAENLVATFADRSQIEIIQQDILKFPIETLPNGFSVFSNIPFNITSPLLERLFEPHHRLINAYLILQQEAIWGNGRQGEYTETLKSLVIAPFFKITLLHTFSKADFSPQPSVDTALFAFERRAHPLIKIDHWDAYKDFIALVAKDRVGEGIWRKLYSKKQLRIMTTRSGLVFGRGIKSQTIEGMIAAFDVLQASGTGPEVAGSMRKLRREQARHHQINRVGHHHRSKGKREPKGKRDER